MRKCLAHFSSFVKKKIALIYIYINSSFIIIIIGLFGFSVDDTFRLQLTATPIPEIFLFFRKNNFSFGMGVSNHCKRFP